VLYGSSDVRSWEKSNFLMSKRERRGKHSTKDGVQLLPKAQTRVVKSGLWCHPSHLIDADGRLVGPAPGHVSYGVAAATEHHQRDAELLDVLDAGPVALDAQVEAAQPVVGQAVGAALESILWISFSQNFGQNL
jgi:hypothetical protein